jgi:hypothetical protein
MIVNHHSGSGVIAGAVSREIHFSGTGITVVIPGVEIGTGMMPIVPSELNRGRLPSDRPH